MKNIWKYITTFLAGVIAGIIVFIKLLDSPDYQYQVTIKKLKSKGNTGENSGIIPSIKIETDQAQAQAKKKRRGILKRIFKPDRKK